jgi:hypothetical protein
MVVEVGFNTKKALIRSVQHIKTNLLLGIGAGIIVGYMISAATSLNRSFGFGSEPSL